MITAQNWINGLSGQKTTLKKILSDGRVAGPNEVVNPVAAGKLTGSIKIEGFTALEEINLAGNDITELEIINCPNLTKISFGNNKLTKADIAKIKVDGTGNGVPNEVTDLALGSGDGSVKNNINSLDLTNFTKLTELYVQGNVNLHEIKGLEKLSKLVRMNTQGAEGIIRFITKGKLDYLKETVKLVKELMGVDPNKPLPNDYKNADGSFNKQKIEEGITSGVNSQVDALKDQKENVEKERDELKNDLQAKQNDYNEIETERNQLRQQLAVIRNELGLGINATQEHIITEIRRLKGITPCTHTDYDSIKSERDSLKSENTQLKNDKNKENVDAIIKKDLIKSTNSSLEKWGFKVSNDNKTKISGADSAQNVEKARNEVIGSEINKLKSENKSSFYLNIGLGGLLLVSLLALAWVLMRQNNLPKVEATKKK